MRTERDRARCVAVFVGPRCKGVGRGRSGPVDRVSEYCIAENFRQEFNFVAFVKAIFWLI